jgi:NADH dehydrogenase/NADH:ubiquinone oxidoreductase subunit G
MLKRIIEKLEDVDEKYRGFYVEKDGKFVLNIEEEDTATLKGALVKERELRSKAEADLKKWTKLGDAEKAAAALAKVQEYDEKELERKGEFEKIRTQMAEKHEGELKTVRDQLSGKDKAIEKLLVDSVATAAISKHKGKVKVLLPHVKAHVKVEWEAGEPVAKVVDDQGDPIVGDGKGTYMNIEQYVESLKKDADFGANFEATAASGGGAANSGKGTPAAAGAKTVSITDQSAMNDNIEAIAKGTVTVQGVT